MACQDSYQIKSSWRSIQLPFISSSHALEVISSRLEHTESHHPRSSLQDNTFLLIQKRRLRKANCANWMSSITPPSASPEQICRKRQGPILCYFNRLFAFFPLVCLGWHFWAFACLSHFKDTPLTKHKHPCQIMTMALLPSSSILPSTINVSLYHPGLTWQTPKHPTPVHWPERPGENTEHPSTGLSALGGCGWSVGHTLLAQRGA